MTDIYRANEEQEGGIGADPLEYPIGYFGRDTYAISGAGAFSWYKTAEEALDGYRWELTEHLVADDEVAKKVATSLIDSAIARGQNLEAIRPELNAATVDDTEIVWYGSFDELCTSSDVFPTEVREIFLEYEEDDQIPPIPAEQRGEFAEFVRSYGS